MNKAVTDGALLTPPPFSSGLGAFACGDGTPGSESWEGHPGAWLVMNDPVFGTCLAMRRGDGRQSLRYMGETPLLPDCYLRVRVRVRLVEGPPPSIRIGGFPCGAGGVPVSGRDLHGQSVRLDETGEITEVSAIVGPGARLGVDLVWGTETLYGHFGFDLAGAPGSLVHIESISVDDVSQIFVRDMLALVDVRDHGAVGDGTSDDGPAFRAADAAAVASGRRIFVPRGLYRVPEPLVVRAPVRFEGRLSMPKAVPLVLASSFELPTYWAAFGCAEMGLVKGIQALFVSDAPESFDMAGCRVSLDAPLCLKGMLPRDAVQGERRTLRGGEIVARAGTGWKPFAFGTEATFDPSQPRLLQNVTGVANVPVGALVEGAGVGREVFVRSRNIARRELTLSAALWGGAARQKFVFRRFRYLLDFSGAGKLSNLTLRDMALRCNDLASGIMLPGAGRGFALRDCLVSRPSHRGLSSTGTACQGLLMDRCHFVSAEDRKPTTARRSIGFNLNGNDAHVRDCRGTRFLHFAVLGGRTATVSGNHVFQGDFAPEGSRSAGVVFTLAKAAGSVIGNTFDNCALEWTSEYDPATPEAPQPFSAMTVTGNRFLAGSVAAGFSPLVFRPHGPGRFISGVTITGNQFRAIGSGIARADRVDTVVAGLDASAMTDFTMTANAFENIGQPTSTPASVTHVETLPNAIWRVPTVGLLPFGGRALSVEAVTAAAPILDAAARLTFATPYAACGCGDAGDEVHLHWPEPVSGIVRLTLRAGI